MRFADPWTDFAFKKIFGNENAKEVLISFLNAVLALDKDHAIVDVALLNPYEAPRTKYMRDSFLDVKCRDVRGVTFIVEMQVAYVAGFEKRIIYNASKACFHQLPKGDAYPKLNQVISINILDFVLFDDFEHYLSCHQVREKLSGNNYPDEIRYYFIELPKFKKTEKELETYIEKWIYFIKHAADLEAIPEKLDEPVFHKAFDQANRANMTAIELEAYDNSVTVMLDERGRIESAYEKGGQAMARNIARSLKQKNVQADVIVEATGLSLDEVESLK